MSQTNVTITTRRQHVRLRASLLALSALGLLTGLYGGLWQLGWTLPQGGELAGLHGPLMICGGFATLISLERAVAIGRDWPYVAPVLSAGGGLALLAGMPPIIGILSFALAAAIFVAASYLVVLRQPALFTGALLLGALALLAGDIRWATGGAMPDVTGWWLSFLILTIAGGRLELSRMLPPKLGSEALFLFAIGLLVAGAWNGLANENGATLFGIGLFACGTWLLRHDIALRTIRQSGQARFFATCMLIGYCWLGAAGALLIVVFPADSNLGYDLALHSITIGFVLSMLFGHALIILPAITGLRVQYSTMLYFPLAMLHAAVLLRVAGGLTEIQMLRLWSGPLTVVALGAFAACIVIGARVAQGRRLRDATSGLDLGSQSAQPRKT